jgi:release factor glutamine methyltransferase
MPIKDALAWATRMGAPKLDAQMLLLHCLGKSTHDKAFLISHDQDTLTGAAQAQFMQLIERQVNHEPTAYLIGDKEFYGLHFKVSAHTLIPRPDTETLVEWALTCTDSLAEQYPRPRLLDMGTGSGCVALAIKHSAPHCDVWATDLSHEALQVARLNAHTLALEVTFKEGSWFNPLKDLSLEESFCVITSNPPYIRAGDPHLEALAHEPTQALVSGTSGLDDIEHIVSHAMPFLTPEGWLLLEHGYDQGPDVSHLLAQQGFTNIQSRKDLAGIWRCTGAQRPKVE